MKIFVQTLTLLLSATALAGTVENEVVVGNVTSQHGRFNDQVKFPIYYSCNYTYHQKLDWKRSTTPPIRVYKVTSPGAYTTVPFTVSRTKDTDEWKLGYSETNGNFRQKFLADRDCPSITLLIVQPDGE